MIDFLLSPGSYLAYFGIAVFLMLTGAGLPIPEEVFIIAAGVACSQGVLEHWWLAVAACLFGALAGDCILYWIGYHFGRRIVREHHWWTRFVHPEREAKMERMINDHGLKVLFLARFLVGIRAPVYLSAGVLRVPFRRFLLMDVFCAAMVIGTFFGLSYFLGYQYRDQLSYWIREVELWGTAAVVLVLAGGCLFWWRRHGRKRAGLKTRSTEASRPTSPQPEENADQNGPPAQDESFEPVDMGTAFRRP